MVKSEAKTAEEYIANLTPDRKKIISQVRELILMNLPKGYEEVIEWGMLAYVVPLSILPDTYNKKPLQYAALASQKNYNSLYLMSVYGDPKIEADFIADYEATGKKLDMGKSCVRFKNIEDLPLEIIGKVIARTSVAEYVKRYRSLKQKKS